ncbi:MAG TPA: hypothetical protein VGN61_07310, partial [Verrucomicrobiae bacterium]
VNYRRYIVIVIGTVGFTGFFASFALFFHLQGISPTIPIAAAGQVFQLNNHGYLFYVTREQYRLYHVLLSGWGLGALAAVLNYRWKVVRNLTRDGWRLPS